MNSTIAALTFLILLSFPSFGQIGESSLNVSLISRHYSNYPNSTNAYWERLRNECYTVEFKYKGKKLTVEYVNAIRIKETEQVKTLHPYIDSFLLEAHPKHKIFSSFFTNDFAKGTEYYTVVIRTKDRQVLEYYFDLEFNVLENFNPS